MEKQKTSSTKLELICIYDRKSGLYNGISAAVNNAVALRSFADECLNPKSMLSLHAEDYELVNLGTLEMETGKIEPKNLPVVIGTAAQFAKKGEESKN